MADAAEQFRSRIDNLRPGTFEKPEVEETVEVSPTGQAEVVETPADDEDE